MEPLTTTPDFEGVSSTPGHAPSGEADPQRKRHQSEFHAQRPSPSRYLPGSSARDDFDLRRQMSAERLAASTASTMVAATGGVSGGGDSPSVPATPTANGPENVGKLESLLDEQKKSGSKKPDLCACWCSGWAEVT